MLSAGGTASYLHCTLGCLERVHASWEEQDKPHPDVEIPSPESVGVPVPQQGCGRWDPSSPSHLATPSGQRQAKGLRCESSTRCSVFV